MPAYNTVDLILLALLAIGLLRGTMKGLSGELAGIISLVVAAIAGWHFYRPLGTYLANTTRMTDIQADTVSIVVIIFGALILLWALSMLLRQIMEVTFKGLFERIGGALFGLARYAAILAALLLIISQFAGGSVRDQFVEQSFIGRHALERLVPLYRDLVQRYPDLPALSNETEQDALPYEYDEWPTYEDDE